MKLVRILGQDSWRIASDCVEAAITRQGGHLAPVQFHLGRRTVAPYAVAPWAEEKADRDLIPLLRSMRGDFFCMPFGGNDTPLLGERHPAHGETANSNWRLESFQKSAAETELHLSLKTKVRPGRVDKIVRLRKSESALYCRHIISGMSGPMSPGHHATLKFPDVEGSGHISTSAIRYAQVLPTVFEQPVNRGYSKLKPGATFTRLDRVPTVDGSTADLSRYPARRGFEDLVMIVHEARPDFAWTAVTFPRDGWAWFALKEPRVLRSTVFWISNGGRHYPPWNGRHVNVLGMEDVTAYFHYGLAESVRPNPINRAGIATSLTLRPDQPLVVNYIMGAVAVPRGFERVTAIIPGEGKITLHSGKKHQISTPLDTTFLHQKSSS